jgi:hypothetical protein
MAGKLNEKNTKAEILAAYNELLEEKKNLETQARNNKAVTQTNPPTPPNYPPTSSPQTNNSGVPAKMNVNNIQTDRIKATIERLNDLGTGFIAAVGELSEKLNLEATRLADIRERVSEENQRLKTLHDIDADDDTLATLVETYQTSSKTFTEEIKERSLACELQIETLEKTWENACQERRETWQERRESDRLGSEREATTYKYDLELARKLSSETYQQESLALERSLVNNKAEREKVWAETEKDLAEREKTFNEAKTKAEGLKEEKENAVKKAREEGKGIAHSQVKIKADLFAKEIEGQKRFYNARLTSLQTTIDDRENRLETLTEQLESALQQVQDLAVKAIEGSANANSYQTLKEITLEQAKAQAKAK